MCSRLTAFQIKAIEEIAQAESLTDFEMEIKSASQKGDGYLGAISMVNLISNNKKLNLILKTAEAREEVRKKVVVRKAYLREIYMYNKILPEFETFQKENGLQNSFTGFAKAYGSCDKDRYEFLFLENLKEEGYEMWNRKVPMNAEHVALVFAEYGKLHAVSLAMQEKDPGKFRELTRDLGNIFKDAFPKEAFECSVKSTFDKGFQAVKGDKFATEGLTRFCDTAIDFFLEALESDQDKLVATHGDCWCNNMMFKYEDKQNPGKPTALCLLDWQLAKLGSPVLDLAYFFFVCSPKDILYDYERYLKIYHSTVTENLRAMSCDADKIFPYTLLVYHWKKYAKFGLYMALLVITLMLSNEEEVPVLGEIGTENTFLDGFNYDCKHINDYNRRISDIVVFMTEHGLI